MMIMAAMTMVVQHVVQTIVLLRMWGTLWQTKEEEMLSNEWAISLSSALARRNE
jgi:hypothetical protein